MRRLVVKVLKNETILVVASILALISCFIVPPDKEYAGYIHASTISQLICLMLVVCGFQRIGVFRIIGSRLLHHVKTARGLVLTLIALPFFSGMLITNDVALVTFVPFAIAVLTMAHMEEHAVLVGTLMTIGANVGSMLTPIGNAHNLYLKALTGMPTSDRSRSADNHHLRDFRQQTGFRIFRDRWFRHRTERTRPAFRPAAA